MSKKGIKKSLAKVFSVKGIANKERKDRFYQLCADIEAVLGCKAYKDYGCVQSFTILNTVGKEDIAVYSNGIYRSRLQENRHYLISNKVITTRRYSEILERLGDITIEEACAIHKVVGLSPADMTFLHTEEWEDRVYKYIVGSLKLMMRKRVYDTQLIESIIFSVTGCPAKVTTPRSGFSEETLLKFANLFTGFAITNKSFAAVIHECTSELVSTDNSGVTETEDCHSDLGYSIKENTREYESGAVRDVAVGKGRCDLLPLSVIGDIEKEVRGSAVLAKLSNYFDTLDNEHAYEVFKELEEEGYSIYSLILGYANRLEMGVEKYGANNWCKGFPVDTYRDSGVRHYLKWRDGYTDEDHLGALVWNLVCCMRTQRGLDFCKIDSYLKPTK